MSLQRQFDILACKMAQMEIELDEARGDAARLSVRVQAMECLLMRNHKPKPPKVLPGGIVVLGVVDGIKRCQMPDGRIEYL